MKVIAEAMGVETLQTLEISTARCRFAVHLSNPADFLVGAEALILIDLYTVFTVRDSHTIFVVPRVSAERPLGVSKEILGRYKFTTRNLRNSKR
jgi:hypothetical protein